MRKLSDEEIKTVSNLVKNAVLLEIRNYFSKNQARPLEKLEFNLSFLLDSLKEAKVSKIALEKKSKPKILNNEQKRKIFVKKTQEEYDQRFNK